MIDELTIQKIKDAASIVDVIGDFYPIGTQGGIMKTGTEYCMPCPYGIDIPGILSHFNKCINEDLMPVSSQDENYRELRRAFLIGYDRSVPKLRQDNHCVGCDQCIRKCPQRINIPKQMRRIDKFVEALKQGKEFDDKTNYLWSR